MSDQKEDTIFTKIINKEIPADIVYEDDRALCFKDIHPVAPVHLLLIPKRKIPRLADVNPEQDSELMGYLFSLVPSIAQSQGVEDAFRVVVNSGASAGQTVFHLHLHIIGGRALQWPPG